MIGSGITLISHFEHPLHHPYILIRREHGQEAHENHIHYFNGKSTSDILQLN